MSFDPSSHESGLSSDGQSNDSTFEVAYSDRRRRTARVRTQEVVESEDTRRQSDRIRNRKPFEFNAMYSEESNEEQENVNMKHVKDCPKIFRPLIETIFTRKIKNGERVYLCKWLKKAVIHSGWVHTKDIDPSDNSLKQKLKRFDAAYEEKINLKIENSDMPIQMDYEEPDSEDELLEENLSEKQKKEKVMEKTFLNKNLHYINFDSNNLKVDRVVACTEMFDIIHPKKANKIMAKWSDSIIRVIQILINFRYENINYGVHLLNISKDFAAVDLFQDPIDLSIILNRLYLDFYKNYQAVWRDISLLFDQVELYYYGKPTDIALISRRLKRVAVYLYRIWHDSAEMVHQKTSKIDIKDFAFSLFTLKDDQHLQNYAVKLIQMIMNFKNLLFKCEELLQFVLDYMEEKYGIVYANDSWLIDDTSKVQLLIPAQLQILKAKMIDRILVLKLKESVEPIPMPSTETSLPAPDVQSGKEQLKREFQDKSIEQLSSTLRLLDQNCTYFKEMKQMKTLLQQPEGIKLNYSETEVLQQIMRKEMPKDKENIRACSQFKIFREMTEKSILRIMTFFHKKDVTPPEYLKFDPGPFSYAWTGSESTEHYNVIYEESELETRDNGIEIEEVEESLRRKQSALVLEQPDTVEQQSKAEADDTGNSFKITLINPKLTADQKDLMQIELRGEDRSVPIIPEQQPQNGNGNGHNADDSFKFKFKINAVPKEKEESLSEEETEVVDLPEQIKGKGLVDLETEEPELLGFVKPEDLAEMLKKYLRMIGKITKMYLIKWKNVSYNQCTWEVLGSLKNIENRVEDFQKNNRALDKDHRAHALNKKKEHRKILEVMERNNYRREGWGMQGNDYARTLYHGTNTDTEITNQVIKALNNCFKGDRNLKSYQVESVKWMIERRRSKKNFILADEMGLGKTIQSMAFCLFLHLFEKLEGPFLIVAPLSTLPHWKKTFEEWTPLNVLLYHDNESKRGREKCRDLEWYQKDIRLTGEFSSDSKICKFNVIITSFEVFIQDIKEFSENLCIQHIIIDEAHRLKNQNAKVIKVFHQLPCKRLSLLTGTPIQNNIGELWSLLNFIEPSKFSDKANFERRFDTIESKPQLVELKEMLKPFMIRRMKNEVETIPPLEESLIEIELTNFQKMSYKTLYEKNKGILQKGAGLGYLNSMNNLEMQLRKCCNHPFLIKEIHEKVCNEVYNLNQSHSVYISKMLDYSAKMIVLDKLVTKYQKERKKMLIFSQFTEMLKLIETFLSYRRVLHRKIDGATKARERENAIESFSNNEGIFEVFLLSTKAGGLGINLTSANVVLIYDSDWNPQNDVQAIARAHRIGQKEEVKVYRLISKKTYESEMYKRASKKLGLDQAVFLSRKRQGELDTPDNREMLSTLSLKSGTPFKKDLKKFTEKEIETLLKKGIYGLLGSEDEEESEKTKYMDIEELINNSKKMNYSMINDKYTITRMNFHTEKKDTAVAIDDPDFWKKVLKNEDSAAKKAMKELKKLRESNDFLNEDSQKEYFTKLNDQIFTYIEKAKTEEINYEEESTFNNILQSIMDDPFVKKEIKPIATQLKEDLRKKPRRLKKRDMSSLNKPSKVKTSKKRKNPSEEGSSTDKKTNGRRKQKSAELEDEAQSYMPDSSKQLKENGKRKKNPQSKRSHSKISEHVEDGLYRNSDSDEQQSFNKSKKKKKTKRKKVSTTSLNEESTAKTNSKPSKLKRVKLSDKPNSKNNTMMCEFCQKFEDIVEPEPALHNVKHCHSCKRGFHLTCLKDHIEHTISQSSKIGFIKEEDQKLFIHLKDNDGQVFDSETAQCVNCQLQQIDCFGCGLIAEMSDKLSQQTQKFVKNFIQDKKAELGMSNNTDMYDDLDSDIVYQCRYCARSMHIACVFRNLPVLPKYEDVVNRTHEMTCPAHKCHSCHSNSNNPIICIKCPKGYHKKCLRKTHSKLNNKFFICNEHKVKQPLICFHENSNKNKITLKLNLGAQIKSKPKQTKKRSLSIREKTDLFAKFHLFFEEDFEYCNYNGKWCRFCGARYSVQFHDTILGSNTLCDKHFQQSQTEKIQLQKLRGLQDPFKISENREVANMKKFLKENKNIIK